MLATTWVQIVKAVLMLAAAAVILIMVLAYWFDPLTLFQQPKSDTGRNSLLPGNYLKNPFDQISLGLGYVLGLAGLPHVMTRFYTVPDAKTARRSVVWVMFLVGFFFAGTTLFGLAAADFVGQDAIKAADRGGNLTLPLLAQYLGGGAGTWGGEAHARLRVRRCSHDDSGGRLRADLVHVRRDRARFLRQLDQGRPCRGAPAGMDCPCLRRWSSESSQSLSHPGTGRQRRGAGDPRDLHCGERQLPGLDFLVVLETIQYCRRGERYCSSGSCRRSCSPY